MELVVSVRVTIVALGLSPLLPEMTEDIQGPLTRMPACADDVQGTVPSMRQR